MAESGTCALSSYKFSILHVPPSDESEFASRLEDIEWQEPDPPTSLLLPPMRRVLISQHHIASLVFLCYSIAVFNYGSGDDVFQRRSILVIVNSELTAGRQRDVAHSKLPTGHSIDLGSQIDWATRVDRSAVRR